MTPEPLTFPGMELFAEDQAAQLGDLIQNLTDSQPSLVREAMTSTGQGWRKDGFPDTLASNSAETYVKSLGCAALAIQTAQALGQELTAEQTKEILKQAELVYAEIPHLVHAALSAQ